MFIRSLYWNWGVIKLELTSVLRARKFRIRLSKNSDKNLCRDSTWTNFYTKKHQKVISNRFLFTEKKAVANGHLQSAMTATWSPLTVVSTPSSTGAISIGTRTGCLSTMTKTITYLQFIATLRLPSQKIWVSSGKAKKISFTFWSLTSKCLFSWTAPMR